MERFEELKKYKALLDDGIITPEEFEIKKKEILNKLSAIETGDSACPHTEKSGSDEVPVTEAVPSTAAGKSNATDPKKAISKSPKKILIVAAVVILIAVCLAYLGDSVSEYKILGLWKTTWSEGGKEIIDGINFNDKGVFIIANGSVGDLSEVGVGKYDCDGHTVTCYNTITGETTKYKYIFGHLYKDGHIYTRIK